MVCLFLKYHYFGLTTIKTKEQILSNNNDSSSHIKLSPKEQCKGYDHMELFMQQIIDEGGEGIILRDPLSSQKHGRSSQFLKHKVLSLFINIYVYMN